MGDDKIREGLLQSGWPEADVNEALTKAPVTETPKVLPKALMPKSLAVIFILIGLAIAGYFGGAYYMAKFQSFPLWPFEVEVPVLTFTPRPSPSNLEAQLPSVPSDWQTYRNEEYGFEVKLPQGWIQNKSPVISHDEVVLINFASPEDQAGPKFDFYGGSMDISIFKNLNNRTINEFIGSNGVIPGLIGDATGGIKNLKIDNRDAVRLYDVIGEYTTQVAVIKDDKRIIEISVDDSKILDQILSTFRFIEPITAAPPTPTPTILPAPAWLTYTNDKYGYSIRYPSSWKFGALKGYGDIEDVRQIDQRYGFPVGISGYYAGGYWELLPPITHNSFEQLGFSVIKPDPAITIGQLLKAVAKQYGKAREEIKINNINALRLLNDEVHYEKIVVPGQNYLYNFIYYKGYASEDTLGIISTFRFTK